MTIINRLKARFGRHDVPAAPNIQHEHIVWPILMDQRAWDEAIKNLGPGFDKRGFGALTKRYQDEFAERLKAICKEKK